MCTSYQKAQTLALFLSGFLHLTTVPKLILFLSHLLFYKFVLLE
jgi:hypothetical protein